MAYKSIARINSFYADAETVATPLLPANCNDFHLHAVLAHS